MNLAVSPYGNFSNSNKVNFQANLDISKIKFGSYPRNWSKKHWKQVADIFEKATADCPDYTFILDQNHGHFIDFKCVGGGFESVLEGTLRLAETGEKFITMSAERKADVYTGNYGHRYWTKVVEGGVTKYIFFANGYQASDYFRVLGI